MILVLKYTAYITGLYPDNDIDIDTDSVDIDTDSVDSDLKLFSDIL